MGCIPSRHERPVAGSSNGNGNGNPISDSSSHLHPVHPSNPDPRNETIESIFVGDEGAFSIFPLNPGKITQEYRIGPQLGTGAFGVVRKCTHILTGQERAIKIIQKDDLGANTQDSQKFINEIEIMKSLAHPNLINVYEYFQDERFIFIVMELVKGIELLDKILKYQRLGEQATLVIMEQMVNVLNYLHSKNIVHRDIKPENILVDGSSIKLIDFGGARRFRPATAMKKVSGTPFYIAPEVLGKQYDHRCDVWSLGVVMYTMLTGEPPFPGKEDDEIFEKIRKNRINFNHAAILLSSNECQDLLKRLLTFDYTKRVQIKDIIDHPWFRKVRNETIPLPSDVMNNLQNFSIGSDFKKAIYMYLIKNVASSEERTRLIEAFGRLDLNHDGVLSREEINQGLLQVNIHLTPEQLQDVMNKIGGENAQQISYMEFLAATLDRNKLLNEARIEQCFKQFDQDRTGLIKIHNFRSMLGSKVSMTDDQWRNIIQIYDTNGDGVIDYPEFRDILIKLSSG